MNSNCFKAQLDRLAKRYGEQHYKTDFVEILWGYVNKFSDQWMIKTTTDFIYREKYAPLGNEWDAKIAEERERSHQYEKRDQKKDAEDLVKSIYSEEEIKTLFSQVHLIAKKQMSDQNIKSFTSMVTPQVRYSCNKCQDSRFYFDKQIGGNVLCNHGK